MTRDKVTSSWRHYLGSGPASAYAAPSRASDLSGLPAAYVATAELDPNCDEAIESARRLLQADVRSSCTSGPARSTAPRRSCPPRCPSGRCPSSPPPCVAASPPDQTVPAVPGRPHSREGVTRVHCAPVTDDGPVPHLGPGATALPAGAPGHGRRARSRPGRPRRAPGRPAERRRPRGAPSVGLRRHRSRCPRRLDASRLPRGPRGARNARMGPDNAGRPAVQPSSARRGSRWALRSCSDPSGDRAASSRGLLAARSRACSDVAETQRHSSACDRTSGWHFPSPPGVGIVGLCRVELTRGAEGHR
jgi:hypothetical protein